MLVFILFILPLSMIFRLSFFAKQGALVVMYVCVNSIYFTSFYDLSSLRENHLKTLPKSFSRLTELERLDVGHNEFTELVSDIKGLTFYNISVILWHSVLLVEETGVSRGNHRPATSHWQTLSRHNLFCPFFL